MTASESVGQESIELGLFESAGDGSTPRDTGMTSRQRAAIREAFAELGIVRARDQFDLVKSLTRSRIRSPTELTAQQAQALLIQLQRRVEASRRPTSGNAWADREEVTWIDKL